MSSGSVWVYVGTMSGVGACARAAAPLLVGDGPCDGGQRGAEREPDEDAEHEVGEVGIPHRFFLAGFWVSVTIHVTPAGTKPITIAMAVTVSTSLTPATRAMSSASAEATPPVSAGRDFIACL